jgi:hypothetical protein
MKHLSILCNGPLLAQGVDNLLDRAPGWMTEDGQATWSRLGGALRAGSQPWFYWTSLTKRTTQARRSCGSCETGWTPASLQ